MTRHTSSATKLVDVSWGNGELLQEEHPPSSTSARVYTHDFEVVQPSPLPGGVDIDDFLRSWEADPGMAGELRRARREIADTLDEVETLRRLRLKAGLSQALLAERARTTQSHIAHIESGAKDPQTDMIVRVAAALDVEPERVFAAVRAQRTIRQSHND